MHYESRSEVFTPPDDPDATIWRYVDFTKLVSMLETRALYFARSDTLGDEFEGSYSTANVRWRPEAYTKDTLRAFAHMPQVREELRRHTYVNCWNLADYESAALWGLYVPPNGGVAVRSTFRRLTESFLPSAEDQGFPLESSIFVGKIRYADYASDIMPEDNTMWPFVYKRRSFEFENELRALIQHVPVPAPVIGEDGAPVITPWDQLPSQPGRLVTVDLDVLVQDVVVSPVAPDWFSELVKGVCARYELNKDVNRSGLAERPVY